MHFFFKTIFCQQESFMSLSLIVDMFYIHYKVTSATYSFGIRIIYCTQLYATEREMRVFAQGQGGNWTWNMYAFVGVQASNILASFNEDHSCFCYAGGIQSFALTIVYATKRLIVYYRLLSSFCVKICFSFLTRNILPTALYTSFAYIQHVISAISKNYCSV